ncbi:hypothetical protein MTP04_33850 [Lysinibacillus sp. PLM2]|jgi:ribosome biogenesis GTPase|nr:hypothetical protein MTP04_33850 [Lysinibacillus sp. PLM2]
MSLNNDFNVQRIKRYLVIAWDKADYSAYQSDICHNLYEKLLEIDTIAIGVDVIVTLRY